MTTDRLCVQRLCGRSRLTAAPPHLRRHHGPRPRHIDHLHLGVSAQLALPPHLCLPHSLYSPHSRQVCTTPPRPPHSYSGKSKRYDAQYDGVLKAFVDNFFGPAKGALSARYREPL